MNDMIVTESGATPKLALRKLNSIIRDALRGLGEYWLAHFAPEHFTHRGATKYNYTPRRGWYVLRKLKLLGHNYPLVFSGQTRARVLGSRNVRSTAVRGEGRVRVILNAPTLNYRFKTSLINMWQEMTTVTTAENEELAYIARLGCDRAFKALSDRTTKNIAA